MRVVCRILNYFLAVEKVFPEDRDRLARMSLIEGCSYCYSWQSVTHELLRGFSKASSNGASCRDWQSQSQWCCRGKIS